MYIGVFLGILIMLSLIGYMLDRNLTQVAESLERIADALEDKNEKNKKAYLRFEQATEKLEILAKDPLLNIKHPGL